jgi:hypothetical protein
MLFKENHIRKIDNFESNSANNYNLNNFTDMKLTNNP